MWIPAYVAPDYVEAYYVTIRAEGMPTYADASYVEPYYTGDWAEGRVCVAVLDAHGLPLPGARALARLNRATVDADGTFVLPATTRCETGADGSATMWLWQNDRGHTPTHYDLRLSALDAADGRFEPYVTISTTHLHRALGVAVPTAVRCEVTMTFAYIEQQDHGMELRPAAGATVHVVPDRWDVVDEGFVAPTNTVLTTDETGAATVPLLASGAFGAELIVRVTGDEGRRETFRLLVPALAEANGADIEIVRERGDCDARRILLT